MIDDSASAKILDNSTVSSDKCAGLNINVQKKLKVYSTLKQAL